MLFLLVLIALLISAAGTAQLPPKAYYALYFDTERSVWCFDGTGMTTFYLYALPSEGGLSCVELMVPPPSGFSIFNEIFHANIQQPVTGSLPTGLIACFGTCQYNWILVSSAVLVIPDENPTEIALAAYPGSVYLEAMDCSDIKSEAIAFTSLYTNYAVCPGLETEQSTWGAIKSLYE